MATKKEDAIRTELERLRDILYGDYARNTDSRLGELNDRLSQTRRELLQALTDQEAQQANQLEATRQGLEDKLERLAEEMRAQFAALSSEMEAHVARLADDMAERRVLGRQLVLLGQQLQATNGEESGKEEESG